MIFRPLTARALFMLAILSMLVFLPARLHAQEPSQDVLLFSYFRDNGQAGVFLCTSDDGLHFTALNDDKPIFTPPGWKGQNLTRDPSILFHDGTFRMVWTSNWKGRFFGYAESTDLVHWSQPQMIQPIPPTADDLDQPENIWAPEIHFDPLQQDYFVLFSATTKRERTNGDGSDNNGNNTSQYDNRIYITRTKTGQSFSPAKLFFDQGFSCIDAVMRIDPPTKRPDNPAEQRWVMVVKCSRNVNVKRMPGRNLRLSFTRSLNLDAPDFTPVSDPIAGTGSKMFSNPDAQKSMAEGPSLLWFADQWYLYWDEPAGDRMQLGTSPDLKEWKHQTPNFPPRAQHGTAFLAPRKAVGWLGKSR